ncbi:MAG: hypothetical protein CTY21_12125 [Methylomonas sp.]|nr:MAG: hypothetical protein CTY21_12125 [Methylomonas sp.]
MRWHTNPEHTTRYQRRTMTASTPAAMLNRFWWAGLLLICLLLTLLSARQISTDNIKGDALQNLDIALALHHHQTFARITEDGLKPTNLREPFPIMLTAAYLTLSGKDENYLKIGNLRAGEPARFVKLHNLAWVFFGLIASWLLFSEITNNRFAGLLSVGGCFLFFFNNPYIVDSLYTELAAGVLLLWVAWSLMKALRKNGSAQWIVVGMVMGLLCLTKSAFLYIAPPVILLIAFWSRTQNNAAPQPRSKDRIVRALLMGIGVLVMVAPWMYRNQMVFESAQITSGRSGWVLYKRALLNQMSDEEFRGAFSLFGPTLYRDLVKGTSLEVKVEDVKLKSGRLSRLYSGLSEYSRDDLRAQSRGEPENAVSLYRKTSALHVKLTKRMEQEGQRHPSLAADRLMQTQGMAMIMDDPVRHLTMSSLMLWRGFWNIPPQLDIPLLNNSRHKTKIIELLNLFMGISLFAVFIFSFMKRNGALLALTATPVLMIMFYTFLSQNIPRFFAPAHPIMVISVLVILHCIYARSRAKA